MFQLDYNRLRPDLHRPAARVFQDIRYSAVGVSVLLSLWLHYHNDTINRDGVLYLDVAHQLLLGNLSEAYELYAWPFYSGLIAALAGLFAVDVLVAGTLLNLLLYAILVWAFLTLLKVSGANRTVLLLGALVILIHPAINENRAELIRGPGAWAAVLLSMICLIRLKERAHPGYALGFALSLLGGILFRIDLLALLVALPLVLLGHRAWSGTTRLKLLLACYLLPALGAGMLFAWYHFASVQIPLGRLLEPASHVENIALHLTAGLPNTTTLVGYGQLLLTALGAAIGYATPAYLLLAGWQLFGAGRLKHGWPGHGGLYLWLVLINLTYVGMHLLVKGTLSGRYTMPAALVVAVYAAFGLAAIWQQLRASRATTGRADGPRLTTVSGTSEPVAAATGRAGGPRLTGRALAQGVPAFVLGLMLLFTAVDGFYSTGPSKIFLQQGGQWLAQHTRPTGPGGQQ